MTMKITRLFNRAHLMRRACFYVGVCITIATVAIAAEVAKTHQAEAAHILTHVWEWMAHMVTDVTAAEVVAAVLFRLFGATG